jgi:hypothetical protein
MWPAFAVGGEVGCAATITSRQTSSYVNPAGEIAQTLKKDEDKVQQKTCRHSWLTL